MGAKLKQQFDKEMLSIYSKAGRATGYWANRFLQKVRKHGGYQAAKEWLQPGAKTPGGFGRLAELNRLDLSPECLVLQPRWSSLFTAEEREVARSRLVRAGYFVQPEEIPDTPGLSEGSVCSIRVNAYERNSEARRQCIAAHGTKCCICGFSFGIVYGSVAEGYIHVHHLRPLSEIGGEYVVDPVEDLRPVCPNCHAVLHLGCVCRSIEEVRQMVEHKRAELSAAATRTASPH
jgi:hypothetical protein